LLEFLISILSRSQAIGSPSSIAQVMSKRVLETCAPRISLLQIISSIGEIMHSKEKEVQEIQTNPPIIEFVECAEFKHIFTDEGCQKATSK